MNYKEFGSTFDFHYFEYFIWVKYRENVTRFYNFFLISISYDKRY